MNSSVAASAPVTPLPIVDSYLETLVVAIRAAPLALLVLVPFELPWVLCTQLVVPRIADPRAEIVLGSVYQLVWGILGYAALVVLVHAQSTSANAPAMTLVRTAVLSPLRHWARTCASLFIASLVTTILLICFIVPGVLRWLSYAVVLPAVALEPEKKTYPLDRSTLLMRGHRWRAMWFLLPFLVLEMGAGILPLVPSAMEQGAHVEWLVYGVGLGSKLLAAVAAYLLWRHVTAGEAGRDAAPRPATF